MTSAPIRFDDAPAYERYMGAWSQLAGADFLEWLSLPKGLRWLDVGCGNGAFTELILERNAPLSVRGIDPSEAQLDYARARLAAPGVDFCVGDAMAQPFPDASLDVAVMPLVIFFVPEPAVGVAEMARVVSPGGTVAAYAWDMIGGGFPYQAVRDEMSRRGINVPVPPSVDASRIEVLRGLWEGAGLEGIESREIIVERTFAGFEAYWETIQGGPGLGRQLAALGPAELQELRGDLMNRLPAPDATGSITITARANAVRGRVHG